MPPPKREPSWVAPFLAALGSCGNVTRAAGLAGVDVTGPYNRRARYPGFREAWERVMAARALRAAPSTSSAALSRAAPGSACSGRPQDERSFETGSAIPPQDERSFETGSAVSPQDERVLVSIGATGVRLGRGAASRWSKGAEERFLEELTASANVARAAAAAGFSAAAIYKRKLRDQHFSAGWEAAIAVGRARLEAHLLVAAERSFDPEALPVAEGEPKVSVSEAISILKHKPAGASGSEWECDNDAGMSEAEVKALREKIIDKLERVRAIDDREKLEGGWTRDGEDWIPPGWVRAP